MKEKTTVLGKSRLKNYDPNLRWSKHTIKITFMIWDYTGYVTYKVKGNCKCISLLTIDPCDFYDNKFEENPINFHKIDASDGEWFTMELTNEKGDVQLLEDELKCLGDYIIGVEIIAHEPEDDEQ
ncbi:DUF5406 domain-containing protein [Enterococcus gallinarum]|uniref:DUF5406 family protein n=1 Tax=Enterococcus gallinarum TaxID=1353 RepID=UPI0020912DAF|nr:DUF5406 family protein [Enterococcus gallinarum]MCO5478601.1 DUF5406 domain-containing protein [Enterococcus gallinarum]